MPRTALIILITLLAIPSISSAGIKTYTHTVKQSFGGSQTPDDAKRAAIAKAKREVLEIAGTYVESLFVVKEHLKDKNIKINIDDEVLAITAGVLPRSCMN